MMVLNKMLKGNSGLRYGVILGIYADLWGGKFYHKDCNEWLFFSGVRYKQPRPRVLNNPIPSMYDRFTYM